MTEPSPQIDRSDLTCACDPAGGIATHFDAKVLRSGAAPLHDATRGLLQLLGNPAGRSILELGSGRGGFMLELLRSGAGSVDGVELSSASVDVARRRLAAEGLAEHATLQVGNAATMALSPHDWVVLDRVICCYPDAAGLVANSVLAARSRYAFSIPESRGWRGLAAHLSRAFDNGWNRFRSRPCTTFVHDLEPIERQLRAAGFVPEAETHRGLWYVGVFVRAH